MTWRRAQLTLRLLSFSSPSLFSLCAHLVPFPLARSSLPRLSTQECLTPPRPPDSSRLTPALWTLAHPATNPPRRPQTNASTRRLLDTQPRSTLTTTHVPSTPISTVSTPSIDTSTPLTASPAHLDGRPPACRRSLVRTPTSTQPTRARFGARPLDGRLLVQCTATSPTLTPLTAYPHLTPTHLDPRPICIPFNARAPRHPFPSPLEVPPNAGCPHIRTPTPTSNPIRLLFDDRPLLALPTNASSNAQFDVRLLFASLMLPYSCVHARPLDIQVLSGHSP